MRLGMTFLIQSSSVRPRLHFRDLGRMLVLLLGPGVLPGFAHEGSFPLFERLLDPRETLMLAQSASLRTGGLGSTTSAGCRCD
jgi:hypothetical protein